MSTIAGSAGALLQAFAVLQPRDSQTRDAIASLLGFSARQKRTRTANPVNQRDASEPAAPPFDPTDPAGGSALEGATIRAASPDTENVESEQINPSVLGLKTSPTPIAFVPVQMTGAITFSSPAAKPKASACLLSPIEESAIVAAAASTVTESGILDAERLVADLARGRVVTHVPTRSRLTLRHGVDLLVDFGGAMDPFAPDRLHVTSIVRRVVGPDNVSVFKFVGSPLRGVSTGFKSSTPYQPGSRAILLLTDLGAGQSLGQFGAGEAEWLDFARLARSVGRRPVVLTPYGEEYTGAVLKRQFAIFDWDRTTRIAIVIRTLRGELRP